MKAVAVPSSVHKTAGELIHNNYLIIFYHIILSLFISPWALSAWFIWWIWSYCPDPKGFEYRKLFRLFHSAGRQSCCICLFIHNIIGLNVIGLLFVVKFGKYFYFKSSYKSISSSVKIRGFIPTPEIISGVLASSIRILSTSSTMASEGPFEPCPLCK